MADQPSQREANHLDHLAEALCATAHTSDWWERADEIRERLAAAEPPKKRRGSSLGPHDFSLLDQWGRQLYEAFGSMPYHVGSSLDGGPFRDVDVRMLLHDDLADLARSKVRLRAVNLALTLWGRQVTGLNIDCQFQPHDEFHSYDGEHRGALGITTRAELREAQEADADAE